ncbi:hypothetical protein [Massilia scottii]|uniref:hypothetical protein n=1 Tax=Massilia scottii TaxID=3057166 RepID=UPI0027964101|nr:MULTISPECIES: hypothetical protein [unclassified Massilia]MDQ1812769.1 hypothetical protein [Massilia sp. CCM 9210]MDQ1833169.1 hypothetical protein [Massilia sp. CCM 9029]
MDTSVSRKEELERLHGIRFDEKSLTLWVKSTGCTKKEDFEVRMPKGAPGRSTLALEIVRVNPDFCRTTPHVVELNFSWDELGLDPQLLKTASVRVANTFGILR